MSEHRITYITAPSEVAERIATALVEEELAVCVNIIDQVTSIYRWEGQVEKAHESLLIVKATTENTEDLIDKVREIHPYEVPEVICFDIVAGNPDYLDWLSGKEVEIEDDFEDIDEEELEFDEEESDDESDEDESETEEEDDESDEEESEEEESEEEESEEEEEEDEEEEDEEEEEEEDEDKN